MRKSFTIISLLFGVLLLGGASCIDFGSTSNALAGPSGVFRSVDKGETWQPIVSYPTAQGVKSLAQIQVYQMIPDPSDPNALYLATRSQGLYYTYDNGDSWQSVAALAGHYIYSVAVDPKNKCVAYVTDGPHIYKTNDCWRTLTMSYTEERPAQRFSSLAVDYGDSRIVYGLLVGGDLLVSHDAGVSWQVVRRFGFTTQFMAADPFTPHRIYVAAQQKGLFRSDDGGVGWTDLNTGLNNFSNSNNFYRLILHPTKKDSLFWISQYGILRSDDAGATWSALSLITPPGGVTIYSFAVNPNNDKELYYVGTILGQNGASVRSTFYKSIDGGKSWVTKKLPTDTIPVVLMVHLTQNNMLFMGFTAAQ